MDSYSDIFDYYSPGRGIVRKLVMVGDFSCDDLHRVTIKLRRDFVEQFISNGEKSFRIEIDKDMYYGSRSL